MFYIAILFEIARKCLFSGGLRDLKWLSRWAKRKRDYKTWSSAPDAYRCGSLYPAVEIDLLITNYLTCQNKN